MKAIKIRLYPDTAQQEALAKSFGCARWVWNYSLNLMTETYRETGKGLSAYTVKKMLPALKQEHEWLKEPYRSRSSRCSPTRRALAITVKAGPTLELEGKKLLSTT